MRIESILQTLVYFNIFSYPLSKKELHLFARESLTSTELDTALEKLLAQNIIYKINDFYLLENNPDWVNRRLKGNEKAKAVLKKAQKNARFISQFPFVNGVFISGSMSKGFLDEEGDVDYFIITKPNRLWVARTCLIAYKKIFLLNSRKYFCVNYFVDDDSLEIKEKNLFTATEIYTIMPMVNESLFKNFYSTNDWVSSFYPTMGKVHENNILPLKKNAFATFVQWLMKGNFGEFLDKRFMRMTLKRWNKKFKTYTNEEFELLFRSERRVSKHHPSNYQKMVLETYQNKLESIKNQLYG